MRLIDADKAEKLLSEFDWQEMYLPVHFQENVLDECETVEEKPVAHWISIKDRMPEEHDSIFKSSYGTSKWTNGMFKACSDEVLATVRYDDGTKQVIVSRTLDGKWKKPLRHHQCEIISWMPFPSPSEV